MKAKELAEKLLENPDFEVEFVLSEYDDNSRYGFYVRRFDEITVEDVGYSSKVIILGGSEY